MTEVAVQYGQEYIESLTYEQKVEKLDELLTRLDKYEPSRRRATLLTFNAQKPGNDIEDEPEPTRGKVTLLTNQKIEVKL